MLPESRHDSSHATPWETLSVRGISLHTELGVPTTGADIPESHFSHGHLWRPGETKLRHFDPAEERFCFCGTLCPTCPSLKFEELNPQPPPGHGFQLPLPHVPDTLLSARWCWYLQRPTSGWWFSQVP